MGCDPPGTKLLSKDIFGGFFFRNNDEDINSSLTESLLSPEPTMITNMTIDISGGHQQKGQQGLQHCAENQSCGEEDASSSLTENILAPEPTIITDMTIDISDGSQQKDQQVLQCSLENQGDEIDELQSVFLRKSKFFASIIGFIVGCFIQFSSLGANFLITSLWGGEVYFQRRFIILSMIWCFITSIMGALVLLFLRGLVITSFRVTTSMAAKVYLSPSSPKRTTRELAKAHQFIAEAIVNIEHAFAMFSLIGVCLSWLMTDIFMSIYGYNIIYTLITMSIALSWCKFVMMCCSKTQQQNVLEELLENDSFSDDSSMMDYSIEWV